MSAVNFFFDPKLVEVINKRKMWNKDWSQATASQKYESKTSVTANGILFRVLFKSVKLWVLMKRAKPLSLFLSSHSYLVQLSCGCHERNSS